MTSVAVQQRVQIGNGRSFDWQAEDAGMSPEDRRVVLQTAVDEWNGNNPTIATPFGQTNLERAKGVFPNSHGEVEQMWIDRFTDEPELIWKMVGDIVRYVSSEEVPRGQRKSSVRQVQARDANMAAVWRIIGPEISHDPFPIAVRELIGTRSIRQFASRAGYPSHHPVMRYIRGERSLTFDCMEKMAKAGRVKPFFFVEYRAMWLGRELMNAMMKRPQESMKAVKLIQDSVV